MTAKRDELLLYGQMLSWYSTKVRAYLKYKGIDYTERSPTLITYYWTIRRRFGDPAMPAVVTPDGEWLQDSSIIIDHLEVRHPEPPVFPSNPVQRFAASVLELWADEFWHVAAVHTRWSFPEQNYPVWEAEMSQGFAPWLPRFLQRKIATIPKKMMLDYLPLLGIVPEQVPLIHRWIDWQLDALDEHFSTMPYLFGSRASIADFALFGPIDGHMYRDVSSRGPMIESRPHLNGWVGRLKQRRPEPWPGEFLAGDRLPDTLGPLFRSVFHEMEPYLEGTLREVEELLPTLKPGERLPRMTDKVTFPFCDGTHFRQGVPFALWMAQRSLDLLAGMGDADGARVRDWVRAMNGQRFLDLRIPRLRRAGLHAAPDLAG